MSSEPPPIAALQAYPLLERLLRRCLENDRERRWQSIRDVTSELRWIASHRVVPAPAATVPGTRRSPWRWAAAGLTIVFALLVVLPLALLAGLRLLEQGTTQSAEPRTRLR